MRVIFLLLLSHQQQLLDKKGIKFIKFSESRQKLMEEQMVLPVKPQLSQESKWINLHRQMVQQGESVPRREQATWHSSSSRVQWRKEETEKVEWVCKEEDTSKISPLVHGHLFTWREENRWIKLEQWLTLQESDLLTVSFISSTAKSKSSEGEESVSHWSR